MSALSSAVRGHLVWFAGDPFLDGVRALRHETDGIVATTAGRITMAGAASDIVPRLPPDRVLTAFR